jgi:hypothetical protein
MARIAGVTPQAVNGWFKKGFVAKSLLPSAEAANVSVTWLLGEEVSVQGLKPNESKMLGLLDSYLSLNKKE